MPKAVITRGRAGHAPLSKYSISGSLAVGTSAVRIPSALCHAILLNMCNLYWQIDFSLDWYILYLSQSQLIFLDQIKNIIIDLNQMGLYQTSPKKCLKLLIPSGVMLIIYLHCYTLGIYCFGLFFSLSDKVCFQQFYL